MCSRSPVDPRGLLEFVAPYYQNKDTMHDLSHIERVLKGAESLAKQSGYDVDMDVVECAAHFHGFVYSDEGAITEWLGRQNLTGERIRQIVQVAWESQKACVPESLEGKILHDAHMIEGGKTFLVVKVLMTGAARGQTLRETIAYLENSVLGKGECYLPEAKGVYREQQEFAREFVKDLREGLR